MSLIETKIPRIEVFGGLTSRLYTLSIISYLCPKSKFYWNKSLGIRADFNDLFKNTNIISNNNELDLSYKCFNFHFYGTPVMEEKFNWINLNRFPNSNINIDNAGHSNDCLNRCLLDRNGYLYIDYPVRIFSEKEQNIIFCNFIDSLVLTDDLYNLYFKYATRLVGKKSIGINVRNCQKDTINHHWTNEINFKDILRLSNYDCDKIFLTCCFIDENIKKIIDTIGDKLVMLDETNYPLDGGESINGVGRALVEWLLLASTTELRVSKSGYALKAGLYGNNLEKHNIK